MSVAKAVNRCVEGDDAEIAVAWVPRWTSPQDSSARGRPKHARDDLWSA